MFKANRTLNPYLLPFLSCPRLLIFPPDVTFAKRGGGRTQGKICIPKCLEITMNSKCIPSFTQDVPVKSRQFL